MAAGRVVNRKDMGNQIGLLACLITCIILSSCGNSIEDVRFFEQKELPQQTVVHGKVDRSEYGNKQLHLEADRIVQYGQPDPRTEYPEGVKLWIYDDKTHQLKTLVTAGRAITHDNTKLTEVHDNVVIIDFNSGDTSYLHDLYWNAAEHRIYSQKPVRSVNGNRVTYGDGFESDDNFDKPLIIRQRGTIEWKEDTEQ